MEKIKSYFFSQAFHSQSGYKANELYAVVLSMQVQIVIAFLFKSR